MKELSTNKRSENLMTNTIYSRNRTNLAEIKGSGARAWPREHLQFKAWAGEVPGVYCDFTSQVLATKDTPKCFLFFF